jgi:hypothetical protein
MRFLLLLALATTGVSSSSTATYNSFAGTYCFADGIQLDGVDDFLQITPAFTLTGSHTVATRFKYTSGALGTMYEFSTGCGNPSFYVDVTSGNDLDFHIDGCSGTDGFNTNFWYVPSHLFHDSQCLFHAVEAAVDV